MLLDLITLRQLAAELHTVFVGRRIETVLADAGGLSWAVTGARENAVRLDYGPPGRLRLTIADAPARDLCDGAERYLLGARVEAVDAAPRDRILQVRLSRRDALGEPTYGHLHIEMMPPRFRAALVGERHGRVFGAWAGARDRRASRRGEPYEPTPTAARLLPGADVGGQFHAQLQQHSDSVAVALREVLVGADRHVVGRLCADAGVEPDLAAAACSSQAAMGLWTTAVALYSGSYTGVWRWHAGGGQWRVSVFAPTQANVRAERYTSVCAALQAPLEGDIQQADSPQPRQRARLRRALAILERRVQALQADLDEAAEAEILERQGNSLLAALERIDPSAARFEIADAHDVSGAATYAIQLAPGETAADHAARLLKRGRRFRRRRDRLPARLHRVREQANETRGLLERVADGGGEPIPEAEMEGWQSRVEVQDKSAGRGAGQGAETGSQAHPRRYRTSTGWSVWAGRNNRENDLLTHKLAAQNDVWFHAHGYAGSHVVLRRDGRKEEPSGRTLEEAAAVAAYWSKGRTANKVAVVYTLAKFVSKPRGGAPGLAVMKREKTIMVRPALPCEEDAT